MVAPGPIPDRVRSTRLALGLSLVAAAVSAIDPVVAYGVVAVVVYLYVQAALGARTTELPWMWLR